MRAAFCALAVTWPLLSHSQEWAGVSLGKPQFVATGVQDVTWADDGKCLAYTTVTQDGTGIGVYDVDKGKGREVVRLAPGEVVASLDWLKAGKKAVVVIAGQVGEPTLKALVLDAHESIAKEVFFRKFKPGEAASLDVQVSPLLAHALLTLNGPKTSEIWVLTAGGNTVQYSRDIATAVEQGSSFADWSNAGTAIFSNHAGGQISGVVSYAGNGEGNVGQMFIEMRQSATIELSGTPEKRVPFLSKLPILSRLFLRVRPEIPAGTTVLECVPSNGALRSVRFPGYYVPKPDAAARPEVHAKLTKLTLGRSVAGSNALWLTPRGPAQDELADGEPPRPPVEPETGVLVSAQADAWWPAPSFQAIAFEWNGAVFVRTVANVGK